MHLTNILCTLCLKGCGIHATPVFICNNLKGDLYIDISIMGLFQICLGVSQTLGESLLLYEGEVEELVQPGGK